ncbi:hypothetical protein VUR80DRAFT_2902 [Thermomyces stellatus]
MYHAYLEDTLSPFRGRPSQGVYEYIMLSADNLCTFRKESDGKSDTTTESRVETRSSTFVEVCESTANSWLRSIPIDCAYGLKCQRQSKQPRRQTGLRPSAIMSLRTSLGEKWMALYRTELTMQTETTARYTLDQALREGGKVQNITMGHRNGVDRT